MNSRFAMGSRPRSKRRNVANEYYLRGMSENFVDVDAFVVGLRFQTSRNCSTAYRLRLARNGGIEWLTTDGEKEMILTTEPDSSPWLRFKSWLLSPFVPEEQL